MNRISNIIHIILKGNEQGEWESLNTYFEKVVGLNGETVDRK